jgi:hypothetical protein
MAVGMQMAVFWVVAPYSLVEVYRRFRVTGSKYFRNVDELVQRYTALLPATRPS